MTYTGVDMGVFPGGAFSFAFGCSGNRQWIVGTMDVAGSSHAFRFNVATLTYQDLGLLPGGTFSSAHATNFDGSVVVGAADTGGPTGGAFRWTQASGMVQMGFLAGGDDASALSVSDDGKTASGYSAVVPFVGPFPQPPHPCIWNMLSPSDLGLFGSNTAGIASGLSGNGLTAGGGSNFTGDLPWLYSGSLGAAQLPSGDTSGAVNAISNDAGSYCGYGLGVSNGRPYIVRSGTLTAPGFPAGDNYGIANGISGNGRSMVGSSGTYPSLTRAWVWNAVDGFVILDVILGQAMANGISPDELLIVGQTGPGGSQHGAFWFVPAPPPPPPPPPPPVLVVNAGGIAGAKAIGPNVLGLCCSPRPRGFASRVFPTASGTR